MSVPERLSRMIDKDNLQLFVSGVLNSYSQVFFSDKKSFSVILLAVTFVDPYAGFYGLISVLFTNLAGLYLGFSKTLISRGIYGFNSLLTGLGLGIWFAPGWHLLLIVILAAVLTLFISISAEGVIGKYGLPYLSVPFIITIWVVMLATRDLSALGISHRGVFTLNELYQIGGSTLVRIYELWHQVGLPPSLRVYFISLGAIFFQFNVLSGVIIAFGLLYYSRIAFTLSLLGFYSAFLFYEVVGANLDELNYSYIGFNYILTAIAVGGFYTIPNRTSYLCVICLIPIVALLTMSLSSVFAVFYLPIYSLPFNIIVLLFLYVMKFRVKNTNNLHTLFYQYNSPEKNLYSFLNETERFSRMPEVQISLPFYGRWTVTQGYDGEHTHKDEWRHALDFEILDDEGKPYRGTGDHCKDYYCYDKAVLAPAEGTVEEVTDGVADNRIGQVNLIHNWGNTLIIKHGDHLYSKMSHLRDGSIVVKKGEKVMKGQAVARCGNSGRSPVPHLHFQMQETPWIGSGTIEYPVSHFIWKNGPDDSFRFCDIPRKGEIITNVEVNPLLNKAFNFVPGQKINIREVRDGRSSNIDWEVKTNIYNRSYIQCLKSGSIAWFINDGTIWYFTYYEGSRSTLLYRFYLAAYKMQQGFYKGLSVEDQYPANLLFSKLLLFFQDLVAPFYVFLKSAYRVKYAWADNPVNPGMIRLESEAVCFVLGRETKKRRFMLLIDKDGIRELRVTGGNTKIVAEWEE